MLNSFASHHFASALFWPLDGGPGVPLPRLVQNLTLARQPQTFGPSVFTYRDLIDRVLLFANAGPGSEQFPEYCVAVEEAYRVVFQSRKWRSMLRMLTINYEQPQGTYPDGSGGTVSYTNSTRTMTLTGATWPSWVQYATIRIGDEAVYTVDGVIDSNNILLGVNTNPGQDLAAGTPYQCFRAIYTLPPDFLKLYMPEQNVLFWKCRYVEPNQWYSLTSHLGVASTPFLCTIMSDPKLIGSYAIYFYPFPVCDGPGNSAGGIYLAAPQNIRVTGYSPNDYTGTISGTSGSATITGVGTNFSAQYIGSIFRPSAIAVISVSGLAFDGRTTSSSFMTLAGEKKCVPATYSGRFVTEASSSISSAEVLLNRNAPGFISRK